MAESPSADSGDSVPEWLAQLRQLAAEEAIRWKGHELDKDGWHDEDACRVCLEQKAVLCSCRCGECCKALIVQADLEDAKRESKIAERGSPLYTPAELTRSGKKELEGYLLNRTSGPDHACVFLDAATLLCTIHETRPLVCRLFNCDDRARLIDLGILPPRERRAS
jgi:Fe-S-cluster containining protein